MKHYLILLVLSFAQVAKAQATFTEGHFSYEVGNDGLTVTGYSGNEDIVNMPSIVNHNGVDYIVRHVGNNVFSSVEDSVYYIHFPDSALTIGNKVAYDMPRLAYIVTGNSLVSIGDSCFCNCDYFSGATIGKSVDTVGVGTFSYFKNDSICLGLGDERWQTGDQYFRVAFKCKRLPIFKEPNIDNTLFKKAAVLVPEGCQDDFVKNRNNWQGIVYNYFGLTGEKVCVRTNSELSLDTTQVRQHDYQSLQNYSIFYYGDTIAVLSNFHSSPYHFDPPFDGLWVTRTYIPKYDGRQGVWLVANLTGPVGYMYSCTVTVDDYSDRENDIYAFGPNNVLKRHVIASRHPTRYSGIQEIDIDAKLIDKRYYDITGRGSTKPHCGMNIVVEKYDNGKIKVTKIVRYE